MRPTTPEAYLAALPPDRREAIAAVRDVILQNLPEGYAEIIQYGMIGYGVPHSIYPAGYHCNPAEPLPFASIASQKNHMALYLFCIYMNPSLQDAFREAWLATGKKLDMGKGCVRFKKLDDVPLHVIGDAVRQVPVDEFVRVYEAGLAARSQRPASPAGPRKKPSTPSKPSTAAAKAPAPAKPAAKATAKPTAKAGPKPAGRKSP